MWCYLTKVWKGQQLYKKKKKKKIPFFPLHFLGTRFAKTFFMASLTFRLTKFFTREISTQYARKYEKWQLPGFSYKTHKIPFSSHMSAAHSLWEPPQGGGQSFTYIAQWNVKKSNCKNKTNTESIKFDSISIYAS